MDISTTSSSSTTTTSTVQRTNEELLAENDELQRQNRMQKQEIESYRAKKGTQESVLGFLYAQSPKYDPELATKKKKKPKNLVEHGGRARGEQQKAEKENKKPSKKRKADENIDPVTGIDCSTSLDPDAPSSSFRIHRTLKIITDGAATIRTVGNGALDESKESTLTIASSSTNNILGKSVVSTSESCTTTVLQANQSGSRASRFQVLPEVISIDENESSQNQVDQSNLYIKLKRMR